MGERCRVIVAAVFTLALAPTAQCQTSAKALEPLVYTIQVLPERQSADVEVSVPTEGRATVEMMIPVWTPGYYVREGYANRIKAFSAETPDRKALHIEKPLSNRWTIETEGAPRVVFRYRLECKERSVSLNWVGRDYALFNGSATYVTLVEKARRPHEVRLQLPAGWTRSMTGLATVPDGIPHHYRAQDFEELVDSPILAGFMTVRRFDVHGSEHYLVSAGDASGWDGDRFVGDLEKMVEATRRFWGFLPFERYVFLLVFREGGGALEHCNSTMVTANPMRSGTKQGYEGLLGLVTHEYFHAFNVKRLRPVELGPFDFENPPRVTTLWIPEGLTSYYAALMLRSAALRTEDETLAALSRQIARLQSSPGRLEQTLEQSSYDVWTNSLSGVNPGVHTVSYYVKGYVLGFLLDAEIRRMSGGRKSLDDLMRLAYQRFGGEKGFTLDEFRVTAEEVAGGSLEAWFRKAVATTEELDYDEALNWFGLQFTDENGAKFRKLERRNDRTELQEHQLQQWLRGY
jgi:predicted metalloprotease with PDZ domain